MKRFYFRRSYILIALFLCAGLIWYAVVSEKYSNTLTVVFLDVGQGDAIYIKAPNGNQLMVDGGPSGVVLSKLGEVMPFYDRSIDAVLVSNPDSDHLSGLVDILKRFSVDMMIEPGTKPETGVYESFKNAIETEGAGKIVGWYGVRLVLDRKRGVYFDVLFPDQDVSTWKTNDGSIVGKLVYGGTCFVFSGDAPQSMENYVAAFNRETLHCQVLKVGHHGSRTSSGTSFIGTVSPEYAVISSGAGNSYGHPHQETLDILNQFGAKILRTDMLGTIVMESDGESVSVR